jgi:hypothetical protein
LRIVRERVKPERDGQNRKALRERWWQYAEKQPGLVAAITGLERVLVISQVTQHALRSPFSLRAWSIPTGCTSLLKRATLPSRHSIVAT